jgi:GMP synthase (glutamine-hydrolysing)
VLVIENWMDRGGDIERLLIAAGYSTVLTRPYAGQPIPSPDGFDAVILSGGPMSVHEAHLPRYAFLKAVLGYTDRLVAASIPCLGICLGHQLLAVTLGGRVEPMGQLDAGIRQIRPVDRFGHPSPGFFSFVFHRDHVVEAPRGCVVTFSSDGCVIEGFQDSSRPIQAVQFHPEVHRDRAVEILESWRSVGDGRHVAGDPREFDARDAHAAFDLLVSGLIACGGSK